VVEVGRASALRAINGYVLDLTDDEAFDLTLSVAAGQPDAEEICKRLRFAKAPS
jgi:prophage maintenance system killer protein